MGLWMCKYVVSRLQILSGIKLAYPTSCCQSCWRNKPEICLNCWAAEMIFLHHILALRNPNAHIYQCWWTLKSLEMSSIDLTLDGLFVTDIKSDFESVSSKDFTQNSLCTHYTALLINNSVLSYQSLWASVSSSVLLFHLLIGKTSDERDDAAVSHLPSPCCVEH